MRLCSIYLHYLGLVEFLYLASMFAFGLSFSYFLFPLGNVSSFSGFCKWLREFTTHFAKCEDFVERMNWVSIPTEKKKNKQTSSVSILIIHRKEVVYVMVGAAWGGVHFRAEPSRRASWAFWIWTNAANHHDLADWLRLSV